MAEQVLAGEQPTTRPDGRALTGRRCSRVVWQDDLGGYRFQPAHMSSALALAHRHRLPAAPGLFQPTIPRLIDKLLESEVWMSGSSRRPSEWSNRPKWCADRFHSATVS